MDVPVSELLNTSAAELCRFLNERLPKLGDANWWSVRVEDQLSHSQRNRVERSGINSLEGLDLAALLRVLDRNWYDLNWKFTLPSDARHFVKEMQTVRNRWAHASVQEYPVDDVYRDLDTLQRFLAAIEASDELLNRVGNARRSLLGSTGEQTEPKQPNEPAAPEETPAEADSGAKYKVAELVCLKSDKAQIGPVLVIQTTGSESRYQVFLNGVPKWFYESQLEKVQSEGPELLSVTLGQFHAYLTALHIQHPGLSNLYSLNAARVDFIPYQFRPVLKFIRSDRPRLLIADGVGVGKTIEAGLILRELQARRDVRSVLIICPRPLVSERKWHAEMKRFEERFTHLDGATLRYCITETDLEGEWPDQHAKTIVPYSLFDETMLHGTHATDSSRRKNGQRGLLDLDPPPKFDLVIVDEAHHVRNPNTYSYEAVRYFCDNAEAVVFLTATPIQLGNDDLYVLLNLLRPDLIIDKESFTHMAAPNPLINRAVDAARAGAEGWQREAIDHLKDAAQTEWGARILSKNPEFNSVVDSLGNQGGTPEDRVRAVHRLESLHTFSNIINRTRRRDIGEFTMREPVTVSVPFTPEQQELHDAVLTIQARILARLHPSRSINFMMTTIRRQAASCLFGLAPLLSDILSRRIGEFGRDEAEDDYGYLDAESAAEFSEEIEEVLQRAASLNQTEDPKLHALLDVVSEKQSLDNNKLMVFSSYRHTLSYLLSKLVNAGVRVGLVHGGTPDEDRVALRERFKKSAEDAQALDVLLFSEVGCEGLDYQFCDCIVNYDLPWNPMRVEQRIGRIDRNGQKSEKVLIYNMITPGTVDADIYERCLLRIGVFNSALGASEEILGEVANEIRSVAENAALTEQDRREQLQQISDNKIRLIQEQAALEDKQAELFGIRLPVDETQREIEGATSYWLSSFALMNLIQRYLDGVTGKSQEHFLGEKAAKTLRLSQEVRLRLLEDFRKLPRVASPTYKQWESWLKGSEQHLSATFDSKEAVENQGTTFITPLHPLARQASAAFPPTAAKPITVVEAVDDELPAGIYPFAIYEWRYSGVRDDLTLMPVAELPELAAKLPKLLEYGRSGRLPDADMPGHARFEQLEEHHYTKWLNARENHKESNRQIAEHRKESLVTSHRARTAMIEEKIAQANNDKIRRMRQAQLQNAESDYGMRMAELEESISKADLNAEPIAFGVLVLKQEAKHDE